MSRDRPLDWVQRNRTRPNRARPVGIPVQALAGEVVNEERLDALAAIGQAIAAVTDPEFRSHCRFALADHGNLVICVDNATLLPIFRKRWETPLAEVLVRTGRGPYRPRRVVFEQGTAGMTIPTPTER